MIWHPKDWIVSTQNKPDRLAKRVKLRTLVTLSRLNTWFRIGRAFWHFVFWIFSIAVLSVLIAYLLGFEVAKSSSVLLELVGLGYVVRQLNAKRVTFGRPPLFKGGWLWLKGFGAVFGKHQTTSVIASTILSWSTLSARGRLISNPVSNSVFDRIESLERNIKLLGDEIDCIHSQIQESKNSLEKSWGESKSALESELKNISASLQNINVSDSDFEYLGLLFVALGAIANNAPSINCLLFTSCH